MMTVRVRAHSVARRARRLVSSRFVQILLGFSTVLLFKYVILGANSLVNDSHIEAKSPALRWEGWNETSYIFVFGDSYSSTWFNVTGEQPTLERPLGNHDWWDHLVNETGVDDPLPAQAKLRWPTRLAQVHNLTSMLVYNLAAGGAVTDKQLRKDDERDLNIVPDKPASLREQVLNFWAYYTLEDRADRSNWTSEASVFALWTGVNDVQVTEFGGDHLPVDPLFASYTTSIDRLYHLGARSFLIINLPPIEAITDKSGVRRKAVPQFNEGLLLMMNKVARRFDEAVFYHFDVHQLLLDAISEPHKYEQLSNVKDFRHQCIMYSMGTSEPDTHDPRCKYAVNQYFWQDTVHVTQMVDDLIAERIAHDCYARQVSGYCSIYGAKDK